jgi:hypothetical protein
MKDHIKIPLPQMQIDFSIVLAEIRKEYLQDALRETVAGMDIEILDKELSLFVPKADLAAIAARGMRAELIFPVPFLLNKNPKLLGYYRLLMGFSQKAFYNSESGVLPFKSMEERGMMSKANEPRLTYLCQALSECASALVKGIGLDRLTKDLLYDLTLLTLGPQLRGGANVKKGTAGVYTVFHAIHKIVTDHVKESNRQRIIINNAAGRDVMIEFAADPDIVIREIMAKDNYRNIIAIEIKGGTDFSNIHNRLGEAEKSHQKARQAGFVECWTIVNVEKFDESMAHRESPTTNRFYRISHLSLELGNEYEDFRNRIVALTGIPDR